MVARFIPTDMRYCVLGVAQPRCWFVPVRPYPANMESRVVVVEKIARSTSANLERIEGRLDMSTAAQQSDLRCLQGLC
jgi:hypothetical protein